ncbi:MAG: C40 family peptidase [Bacteroidales bacterium]|nr:C40 family peptidase [Bacteroidales bacterium]
MKTRFLLILLTSIGLMLNTCSKDDELSFEEGLQEEFLSEEVLAFCDDLERVEITTDEILLPNGMSGKEFLELMDVEIDIGLHPKSTSEKSVPEQLNLKNSLLLKMATVASFLTTDDNFIYREEGDFKPAQHGLAYSYGQREYKFRKVPPFGACMEEVYGLDCSGFIHQLFKQAGVTEGLDGTAQDIRQTSRLLKYIKKAYPDLTKLKVVDRGQIPLSEFCSGDIIYWLKPDGGTRHIGMIVKNTANELIITQSNGSRSDNYEANFGATRGPCNWKLTDAIHPNGLGTNYGIVRISIEGTEPPDFNSIGVMVKVYGYYTGYLDKVDHAAIQVSHAYRGRFTENVFTASYDDKYEMYGTFTVNGSMKAAFNTTYDTINKLVWKETISKTAYKNLSAFTQTMSCELIKIPKAYSVPLGEVFEIKGETACNYINDLKDSQSGTYAYSLNTWACSWKSHIYIHIDKEEE